MKRLVVCCDGTWNRPESLKKRHPTNVLKLLRAIHPIDPNEVHQVAEYVSGVGTGNLMDRVLGGLTGDGLSANIAQAYHFIANNYLPGDHLYLFGFSRGAFTVRSLSGFLHHVGLLLKSQLHRFPDAYNCYLTTPAKNLNQIGQSISQLMASPSEPSVPVYLLGVWDTVGALGAIPGLTEKHIRLHDTSLSPNVTHAYQALAVHELRKDFLPTLWTTKGDWQEVTQVWFPGAHSDVGGGVPETGLSDITLQWMIDRASNAGLHFARDVPAPLRPNCAAPIDLSCTGLWRARPTCERRIHFGDGVGQWCHNAVAAKSPARPKHAFRARRFQRLYEIAEHQALLLPRCPTPIQSLPDPPGPIDDHRAVAQARHEALRKKRPKKPLKLRDGRKNDPPHGA